MTGPEKDRRMGKGTSERLWETTRRTFNLAAFRAGQYRRLARRKLDLAALQRKIAAAQAELGKLVYEHRESAPAELLAREEVQDLFQRLESLSQAAALLAEELGAIRAETPPAEEEKERP